MSTHVSEALQANALAPNAKPVFAIGVDVGGTKCAGGIVALPEGRVLARRLQPTHAERGGEAVLGDVVRLVQSLQDEGRQGQFEPTAVGIGVAELVDVKGQVVSAATIHWQGLLVAEMVHAATALPTRIESDVRAAARAEAILGAGRGIGDFIYITVGTGISAALVLGGVPYLGVRGLTGTIASSRMVFPDEAGRLAYGLPLESFSAGPALARRLASVCPEFAGTTSEVLELAERGDREARAIVSSAGHALGAAVAHLINTLDPAAVVLGGGLGLAGGIYRASLEFAVHESVWSDVHRGLPLVSASLGIDAGWIGAALAAIS